MSDQAKRVVSDSATTAAFNAFNVDDWIIIPIKRLRLLKAAELVVPDVYEALDCLDGLHTQDCQENEDCFCFCEIGNARLRLTEGVAAYERLKAGA